MPRANFATRNNRTKQAQTQTPMDPQEWSKLLTNQTLGNAVAAASLGVGPALLAYGLAQRFKPKPKPLLGYPSQPQAPLYKDAGWLGNLINQVPYGETFTNALAGTTPVHTNPLTDPSFTVPATILGIGGMYGIHKYKQHVQKMNDNTADGEHPELTEAKQQFQAALQRKLLQKNAGFNRCMQFLDQLESMPQEKLANFSSWYWPLAMIAALGAGSTAYKITNTLDPKRVRAKAIEEALRRQRLVKPPTLRLEALRPGEKPSDLQLLSDNNQTVLPLDLSGQTLPEKPKPPVPGVPTPPAQLPQQQPTPADGATGPLPTDMAKTSAEQLSHVIRQLSPLEQMAVIGHAASRAGWLDEAGMRKAAALLEHVNRQNQEKRAQAAQVTDAQRAAVMLEYLQKFGPQLVANGTLTQAQLTDGVNALSGSGITHVKGIPWPAALTTNSMVLKGIEDQVNAALGPKPGADGVLRIQPDSVAAGKPFQGGLPPKAPGQGAGGGNDFMSVLGNIPISQLLGGIAGAIGLGSGLMGGDMAIPMMVLGAIGLFGPQIAEQLAKIPGAPDWVKSLPGWMNTTGNDVMKSFQGATGADPKAQGGQGAQGNQGAPSGQGGQTPPATPGQTPPQTPPATPGQTPPQTPPATPGQTPPANPGGVMQVQPDAVAAGRGIQGGPAPTPGNGVLRIQPDSVAAGKPFQGGLPPHDQPGANKNVTQIPNNGPGPQPTTPPPPSKPLPTAGQNMANAAQGKPTGPAAAPGTATKPPAVPPPGTGATATANAVNPNIATKGPTPTPGLVPGTK